ncbi:polysaccharide biosynthesis C-terminal domain-containing protein [candidate division KSB1 bacterium]|nr:polysaccharide biosynthesis C-terminal domain-containing protein [candidate division KSB1 bacterium]
MHRRFFKNAGILAITQFILLLRGFIVIPLLTRYFGTINYGVWSQIGIVIGTISPIMILQTDAAIMRYLPGHAFEKQQRWFSAWLLFLLSICFIVCSLLIFFRKPIAILFFGTVQEYALYIPLAAASVAITIVLNVISNWFRVHDNAILFASIDIFRACATLTALTTMLILQKSVYELVLYSVCSEGVIAVIMILYITRKHGWKYPDFSIIKPLVKYGLPLVPAGYAMWGLNYIDRLFLVRYTDFSEIGVYGVSYSLGYMVIPLLMRPFRTMFPTSAAELYNNGKSMELQRLYEFSAGSSIVFSVPAVVGLMVLGKPILQLIATQNFVGGAPVMGFIASGYIFHVLSSYYTISLGLVHRQYLSTISIGIAFVTNFILNYVLIPRYSIIGAALATQIAFLTQLISTFWFAQKHKIFITHIGFPIKVVGSALIMGIGIYYFGVLISNVIQNIYLVLLTTIFLGIVIYAGLLHSFKILSMARVRYAFSIMKS